MLAFGLLFTIAFGFGWGILSYILVAPLLSTRAFQAFRNNEYIFYYNLGLTKWKLLKTVFLINLPMAIPVGIVLYLLAASGIGFNGT